MTNNKELKNATNMPLTSLDDKWNITKNSYKKIENNMKKKYKWKTLTNSNRTCINSCKGIQKNIIPWTGVINKYELLQYF